MPQRTAQGNRGAGSTQWVPCAEVGTLQHVKVMGVGALSTVHGMSIMASIMGGPLCQLQERSRSHASPEVPPLLVDLEAQVQRDAPKKHAAGEGGQLSFAAGLSAKERSARKPW